MGGQGRTAADTDDLLTAEDVAARLAVSVRSVRRYTERGVLAPIQLGRAVRYRAADVERLIAARVDTSGQAEAATAGGQGQPGADMFGRQEQPPADSDMSAPGHIPDDAPSRGDAPEPIDATYRVTPAEIEQAVERTGA